MRVICRAQLHAGRWRERRRSPLTPTGADGVDASPARVEKSVVVAVGAGLREAVAAVAAADRGRAWGGGASCGGHLWVVRGGEHADSVGEGAGLAAEAELAESG